MSRSRELIARGRQPAAVAHVLEVTRPNRRSRHHLGKSDTGRRPSSSTPRKDSNSRSSRSPTSAPDHETTSNRCPSDTPTDSTYASRQATTSSRPRVSTMHGSTRERAENSRGEASALRCRNASARPRDRSGRLRARQAWPMPGSRCRWPGRQSLMRSLSRPNCWVSGL